MRELKIREDRVLKAAKGCPDAARILGQLFPEVFVNQTTYKAGDKFTVGNVKLMLIENSDSREFSLLVINGKDIGLLWDARFHTVEDSGVVTDVELQGMIGGDVKYAKIS